MPTPGGPTKQRIGTANHGAPAGGGGSRLELLHRQVFDDPFLDLVEIVVILIEDLARGDRIETVRRGHRPRHVEHPVDVGADHLVFGRRRGHAFEPVDFAARDRGHRLRQVRRGQPGAKVQRFGLLAFAELVLNRLELLAQVVLPLRVGHLLLRRGFDLAFELEQRHFAVEGLGHALELGDHVVGFEDLLLVLGFDVDQARQHVGQPQRIVEAHHQPAQLLGEPARQRQRAVDQFLDAPDVGVDLDRRLGLFRQQPDRRHHRRAGPRDRPAFPRSVPSTMTWMAPLGALAI